MVIEYLFAIGIIIALLIMDYCLNKTNLKQQILIDKQKELIDEQNSFIAELIKSTQWINDLKEYKMPPLNPTGINDIDSLIEDMDLLIRELDKKKTGGLQ